MSIKNRTSQVQFVDLSAQYLAIEEEVNEAVLRVLRGTAYILGQEVDLFEEEFAAFCRAKYAVGVDTGLSALELALRVYGIGKGDEVITAANTFIATAFAITAAGATPVLVDADRQTYGIDPSLLERAITDRTKAIIPVHLYGHPADMDPILEIASRHSLIVIEDACQAHGATYREKRVGSLAHAAAFSFYPAKNLGGCGDGGMLVTNDGKVADSVRVLRNYGQREKYNHVVQGFNRRLDTLQAAVLRVKLRHLEEWNAMRRRCAALYNQLLSDTSVVTPFVADYCEAVWHLYVVRTANRKALKDWLAANNIATGIHYPLPIHLQPAYRDLGYRKGDFPVTEYCADQILSLPMYAELSPAQIENVTGIIKEFDQEHQAESFEKPAAIAPVDVSFRQIT